MNSILKINYLKSVSNPKESIAGILALTVYNGLPGLAVSEITCPLLLYKTTYKAFKLSAVHWISVIRLGSIILGVAVKKDE